MSEETNTCGCACAAPNADTTTTEATAYRRPRYTVTESAEAFDLDVLVPGVDKAGVEVSLEDDTLAITARRSKATTTASWQPLQQEIPREDFRLTLRVNVPVNESGIEATVADGVLRVHFPKAEEVKPRRIEVR